MGDAKDAQPASDTREAGKPPEPPMLGLTRLRPFPERVDVGEQIVGSSHTFRVAQPVLLPGSEIGGLIRISLQAARHRNSPFKNNLGLDPDPVLAHSRDVFELERRVSAGYLIGRDHYPIDVQFAPTAAGLFQADVVFEVEWHDGVAERHVVHLFGRARRLEDAPAEPIGDGVPRDAIAAPGKDRDVVMPGPVQPEASDALRFAAAQARAVTAVGNLAAWRELGVDTAKENATSYKEMPPDAPWWEELLELAMTMGAFGVFGAISKQLGPKLAKVIRKGTGKDSFLTNAVTDGLKDGLKHVSRAKTRERRRPKPQDGRARPASSNPRINFFSEQKAILLETKEADEQLVDTRAQMLEPVLGIDPAGTIAALDLLADEVNAAKQTARSVQQDVSEQQWISAVAMSNEGGERVFDPTSGEHRTVTKVHDERGKVEAGKGILTIDVRLIRSAPDDESVAVTGASIKGVSQELADRIHGVPLAEASMPIMLVVYWRQGIAWITRDEVGRLRVFGAFPRTDGFVDGTEAQMHRTASRIASTVLAKSLGSWGVKLIESDDATMQGD